MMDIIAEKVLCDLKDHRQHGLIKQRHSWRLTNSQLAMVARFSKNSQRLPRISDNFPNLLNYTENSRKCSGDL